MSALEQLRKHLKSGKVYRRADLEAWSKAVDRHLKALVEDGTLQKIAQGMYHCPAKASFGEAPPNEEDLVRAFLKSDDFLLISPNLYNSLGVGTTQLYNHKIVYNHKRHGKFILGGSIFDFRMKHKFPKKITKEFLFIDLLNNINEIVEDKQVIVQKVKNKISSISEKQLKRVINSYAGERTKKLINNLLT